MTRFQKELAGLCGPYWRKNAQDELAKVRSDLNDGKYSIDNNGVVRNCIGRVVMDDLMEKILMVTDEADFAATAAAREYEYRKEIEAYQARPRVFGEEELAEMRATFGKGTRLIDTLTGESIQL